VCVCVFESFLFFLQVRLYEASNSRAPGEADVAKEAKETAADAEEVVEKGEAAVGGAEVCALEQ